MNDWPDSGGGNAAPRSQPNDLNAAFMAIYGNPELSSNPQALYRKNREGGDVVRMGPMVMLNTRPLVTEALHRPQEFSSGMAAARLGNTRPLIPMQVDPPDHAKYRKVLDPLFSPKQVATLEPDLVSLVDRLIDGFIDQGRCDFAADFAVPLPSLTFLRLLGLPQGDVSELLRLKNAIVHPPRHDLAETERVQREAGQGLYSYFEAAVADKRCMPDDNLVSRLLGAEIDDRKLSDEEIIDICYLILLAGLDTVTDSLTLSVTYLARNPAHRKQIVNDPAVIPDAIDEFLRWESPIPGVPRLVVAETEIGGCPVRPGDVVFASFGSANTDEQALPDAYTVRFDRRPNRHLAFGGGIHRCLGSHLAKLELRVSMREWHRRIPDYEIPPGTELTYTPGLRSVTQLPLIFPLTSGQDQR